MKCLLLLVAAFALNSCNTLMGLGRDSQHAYQWTKNKVQGSGGGEGGDVAPMY